jgi:hypothetical protein
MRWPAPVYTGSCHETSRYDAAVRQLCEQPGHRVGVTYVGRNRDGLPSCADDLFSGAFAPAGITVDSDDEGASLARQDRGRATDA